MPKRKMIVVGGGAAGMMAALFAARENPDAAVLLFERNEKLGKKVYITGKGRCNVTNAAEADDFTKHILRNPRFLYASRAALDNRGLMALLEDLGVPLKIERGDRVFPASDKSSDVIRALEAELSRLGVEIRYRARVTEVLTESGAVCGVLSEGGQRESADAVILATGGLSYPATGSTGDGMRFAEKLGHGVMPCRPALVPIECEEAWPGRLSGLTLKNVALKAYIEKKKLFAEQGEMLLTHFGLSGPLVLTLSSLLPEDLSAVRLSIDLKPALDENALDARLLRDFQEMQRKRLVTVMDGLTPHNLGLELLGLLKFSPEQPVNSVSREQRKAIVALLKGVPLTPKKLRGFDEAIITRGGVDVREVNPSTLESKRVKGLYFAGETLDLDATTGGFNLQIAFSTGALAGKCAARGQEA